MGGVVETTTYKVELLYDIKGEPEKKLDSIAKHAERASHGMNLLERGMAAHRPARGAATCLRDCHARRAPRVGPRSW